MLSLHRQIKHTFSHIETFEPSRPVVKLHGFFIWLLFDWQKKTSRHLNFGETFMFVGLP